MKKIVVALLCAGLAACASAPRPASSPSTASIVKPPSPAGRDCSWYRPAEEDVSKRGDYVAGGLYRPDEKDRVPGAIPDIDCIPEPQVVSLPRSKLGNKPAYTVLDKEYRVLDDTRGFVEEGLASYYGEKFHGRRTSNWEVYDMYAFSAAHKTLPLPSFARVTNLANGKSVVVRINDRGPFHDGRVMDLSLAAAVKLGIYPAGTGRVRVEALQPGDTATGTTFASTTTTTTPIAPSLPPPTPTALDVATRDYRYATAANAGASDTQRFDAWMKERGIHVATGTPTVVASADASSGVTPRVNAAVSTTVTSPAPTATAPPVIAPMSTATAPIAPTTSAPTATLGVASSGAITLQVASFSTRDNADRALATLRGAGIADARVFDAVAKGQPIWRLRVGPLPASAEAELAARLRGLGFAAQRVHD
ncbi:septal ring lytic transglycosylase RlpA family protein [Cognatilysobacter terrigena]|uniref:septal ring lytic transglycosylase RlpA family protein n=1 Tax=Cognatilysobacter terrigena TaxID=2488749 RepID=UPI00105CAC47|nr:septal ring lytic transglycosylase RlpA family protein [Lysobacter terrigena]